MNCYDFVISQMPMRKLDWTEKAKLTGDYRSLIAKWDELTQTSHGQALLIHALAFSGRTEESREAWTSFYPKMQRDHLVEAAFALGLASLRASQTVEAKKFFVLCRREGSSANAEYFHQGRGLYYYFFGKFRRARAEAETALSLSISNRNSLVRIYSGDLLGHSLFQVGECARGIRLIDEAAETANGFQSDLLGQSLKTEAVIYQARINPDPSNNIAALTRWETGFSTQSYYSRANVDLEIARQCMLAGKWNTARERLNKAADEIYKYNLRRQEFTLLHRLCDLSILSQDMDSMKHFLRSAHRCVAQIPDPHFEARLLALEWKSSLRFGSMEGAELLGQKLVALSEKLQDPWTARILRREKIATPSMEFKKGEDPLGDVLDALPEDKEECAEKLVELGLLGLIPVKMKWNLSRGVLLFLSGGKKLIIADAQGVELVSGLTRQMSQLLRSLMGGEKSKGDLIREVWRYSYDPSRHDSLVYSAMHSLKRILRSKVGIIETTETGWRLNATSAEFLENKVKLVFEPVRENSSISELGFRQQKALRILLTGQMEAWTIRDYQKKMKISHMTAFRDLKSLVEGGWLQVAGKGRATVYFPTSQLKEISV